MEQGGIWKRSPSLGKDNQYYWQEENVLCDGGWITRIMSNGLSADRPDPSAEILEIDSRRELFVDEHVIEELNDAERRLHTPTREKVALRFDEPWEGGGSGFPTIFEDDDRYRLYYRATGHDRDSPAVTCYAESQDGIHWEKPDLSLVEYQGSTANNIIWDRAGAHNFAAFKDPNPDCDPDAQYKAIGFHGDGGLGGLQSADGLAWSPLQEDPLLSDEQGHFDSQNTAIWDPIREEYRMFSRIKLEIDPDRGRNQSGRRIIQTSTSEDFREWTDPVPLEYPDAPPEELYTNVIKPYDRAPHIMLGFPKRYIERDWESESMRHLPGWEARQERAENQERRIGSAVTDSLFMASRDGRTFHRWPRAFLRPGLWRRESTANWVYGDNGIGWHLIETESTNTEKPRELSLYATEGYRTDQNRLQRYSMRLDGFVSVQASIGGGELLTKPLRVTGDTLSVNYATSAAGSIRVELQSVDGAPLSGFSLAASPELFGDELDRAVRWTGDADLGDVVDRPFRLRFVLADADLYSFQFR